MFYRFVLIVTMTAFATACSDPKAANEANFKIAIQKDLDTAFPRCYLVENFPAVVAEFGFGTNKATFKALENAGLLSEKQELHKTVGVWGNKEAVQPVFYLTEEGKKFYKADAGKTRLGEKAGGFCFGKATVKEITLFTEPADSSGVRMSQVTYKYTVSDFPAWAKLPEVLSVLTSLKSDIDSETTPIEGHAFLTLTNKGWVNAMPRMGR